MAHGHPNLECCSSLPHQCLASYHDIPTTMPHSHHHHHRNVLMMMQGMKEGWQRWQSRWEQKNQGVYTPIRIARSPLMIWGPPTGELVPQRLLTMLPRVTQRIPPHTSPFIYVLTQILTKKKAQRSYDTCHHITSVDHHNCHHITGVHDNDHCQY